MRRPVWTGASPVIAAAVAVLCLAILIQPNLMTFYMILAVIIAVVAGILNRRAIRRQVSAPPCLVGVLFVATALASTLWAVSDQIDPVGRAMKLAFALLGLLALMMVPLRLSIARSVGAGLLIGLALVAFVLVENGVLGIMRTVYFLPDALSDLANFHKVPTSILALLAFPAILIAWHLRSGTGGGIWLWLGGAIVSGILFSGHLTAVLAVSAGAIAAIVALRMRWLVDAGIMAVVITLMLGLPAGLPDFSVNAFLSATKQNASLQHRLLITDFTLERIRERPLLGWGMDASRDLPGGSDRIVDTASRMARLDSGQFNRQVVSVAQNLPLHPHNAWLQIRLELGLPGVVVVLLGLWLVLRGAGRLSEFPVCAAAYGTIVTGLILACVSYSAWQSWWLASLVLTAFFFRLGRRLGRRLPET